jgi:hypothetical protein
MGIVLVLFLGIVLVLFGNREKREVAEGRSALLAGGQICPSSSRQNNTLTKKRRADLPGGRKKRFPG